MRGVWPLTGRSEELRFVDAAVRSADRAQGVVLAGGAGVGKTRLARECVGSAEGRGMAVRWVAATASAQRLPLGAFAPLLGRVEGEPAQVLTRAREALLSPAGENGILVAVDDAHLLDDVSAALLHQLVLVRRAAVVVTVRSGDPVPDAVAALWKDDHLDRLEVQPLSEPETMALLEHVLGGHVDPGSVRRLWTLTRGNALFLRHLVEGERHAGGLAKTAGVWRWAGTPTMSPGLVELVGSQMGSLADPVAEVVDLLALGEPLGVTVLVQLADREAVEQAEDAGLVHLERDGRRLQARLAHPMYGEVRRDQMGLARAGRLCGRLATALAGTGARRSDDTLRQAVLSLDSDLDPEPRLLDGAARTAMALHDLALCERLARAAAAAGGGFDAQLTLAYTLSWVDRGEDADGVLTALAGEARTDAERAVVAIPRAGNLFFALDRPDDAESVLESLESVVDDPVAHQWLDAMQAVFRAYLGRAGDAVETARRVLAYPAAPEQAVVLAAWGLTAGLGATGQADEASHSAMRGYHAAVSVPDRPILQLAISDVHIVALRLAGYVEDAQCVAHDRHEETRDDLGVTQHCGVALMGHAALVAGRLDTAIRRLQEGRAGLAVSGGDRGGWDLRFLMSLTQAQAMIGDTNAAMGSLAELKAKRRAGFAMFDADMLLAEGWVVASEGVLSEAVSLARRAAEVAADRGHHGFEVLALHTAARLGDGTVATRLEQLAAEVDGPRAPAAALQAAALAANDADGLRAVSATFEEYGDLLSAADTAAQASAVYLQLGQRGSARTAAARAQRLAQVCQGARTPALLAAAQPLPLTPREREIVTLASQGLSNRQIADRLVVSVRTVEGHLYRAGTKLGVTDRRAFAAIIGVDEAPE